jgi:hypothetical protein
MAKVKFAGLTLDSVGALEVEGPVVSSLLNLDAAYVDFDSSSIGYARIGPKRNGAGTSGGLKLRTLNAGTGFDAVTFNAAGVATFHAATVHESTLQAGDSTLGFGSAANAVYVGKSATDTYGILAFGTDKTNTGMVGFAGTAGDTDLRYRVPTGGSHLIRVNNVTMLVIRASAGKTILEGTWPTSAAGLSTGALWSNAGVLNVAP